MFFIHNCAKILKKVKSWCLNATATKGVTGNTEYTPVRKAYNELIYIN